MATACCYPEAYRERIDRAILVAKKINEQYELLPDYHDAPITGIEQGHSNSSWSKMLVGRKPQVYHHSNHRVPVPETDPKLKFSEAEYKRDSLIKKRLKMREKSLSLLTKKNIPEEEMDIEEYIHVNNNTAVWDARWENLQLVKVCKGPTEVEAAEAATDFIKKVKIEKDIEMDIKVGLLEDAQAEMIEDGKENTPHFSQ